jgi:formate dehydrogenase subunit gamma
MDFWMKRIFAAAAVALLIAGIGGAGISDVLVGPAAAQVKGNVPGRSLGNQSDSEYWRATRRGVQGTVSIPDKKAGVVVQSEGENWRNVRNGPVSVYGGWLMGGTIVLLAVFFVIRGRVRIERGFSGQTVERFNGVERFTHWLTAVSFIVLGLTGLNMMYGRYVIKPLIGPEAFSTLTEAGKYAHNFVSFAFMIGIIMLIVLWIRQNIPNRHDLTWLAKGGGILVKGVDVSAKKFNAGQKIVFWLVVLAGLSISVTGVMLMFPFMLEPFGPTFWVLNIFGTGLPTDLSPIQEMQLTQLWHAVLGLLMVALIIAHIYIGSLGMVGAFDSMGSGQVDINWAREHHDLWVEELDLGAGASRPQESGDD